MSFPLFPLTPSLFTLCMAAFANMPDYTAASLAEWDVSSVTDFSYMFTQSGVTADLSNWNVGSGTNFRSMFNGAADFNTNLCAWGELLREASFGSTFVGTQCPSQSDPNLFTDPPSPLCFQCT